MRLAKEAAASRARNRCCGTRQTTDDVLTQHLLAGQHAQPQGCMDLFGERFIISRVRCGCLRHVPSVGCSTGCATTSDTDMFAKPRFNAICMSDGNSVMLFSETRTSSGGTAAESWTALRFLVSADAAIAVVQPASFLLRRTWAQNAATSASSVSSVAVAPLAGATQSLSSAVSSAGDAWDVGSPGSAGLCVMSRCGALALAKATVVLPTVVLPRRTWAKNAATSSLQDRWKARQLSCSDSSSQRRRSPWFSCTVSSSLHAMSSASVVCLCSWSRLAVATDDAVASALATIVLPRRTWGKNAATSALYDRVTAQRLSCSGSSSLRWKSPSFSCAVSASLHAMSSAIRSSSSSRLAVATAHAVAFALATVVLPRRT